LHREWGTISGICKYKNPMLREQQSGHLAKGMVFPMTDSKSTSIVESRQTTRSLIRKAIGTDINGTRRKLLDFSRCR